MKTYYIQLNLFCNSTNTIGRSIQVAGTGVNSGTAAQGIPQYCIFNIQSTSTEMAYQWVMTTYMASGQTIYFLNVSGSPIMFYYGMTHTNLTITKLF